MDQDRFTELTWTFLLWSLPDSELAEWQAELERRGAEGQTELARMRETIASFALTAPPAPPPPELRERILGAIEALGDDARAIGVAGAPAGVFGTGREGAAVRIERRDADVVPLGSTGRQWIAAAAAAATLAALLALWSVRLREDLRQARQELGETRQQLAVAREQAAAGDSARAQLEASRRDLDVVAAPAGSAHTLLGTPEEPGARARIFVDPETGRALLLAFELPILPPGTVYELWAIRGGIPVAAGVFAAGQDGRARVDLESAQALQDADALAVTVEPAPGTSAPTGRMVLTSS